jgi:ATP-dependent protease ClpP protease subunit
MPAVALVFNGPINYPATKIFRNVLCNFAGGQPMQQYGNVSFTEVYILMSSEGGSAEDAIALYNLISALPADVYTVNMGQIASAANVVFLAGKKRWACEHSYFHFHNFSWTYGAPQSVGRQQMLDHAQILDVGRNINKSIFKEKTGISSADFETLQLLEKPMIIDSGTAKQKGIVHEIGRPTLPADTPILNIDY